MTLQQAIVDTLLATKSDAIIATDSDGLINFWNPGAVRIFGFSAEEAVGQPLDIIIPENIQGAASGPDTVMSWQQGKADMAQENCCQSRP